MRCVTQKILGLLHYKKYVRKWPNSNILNNIGYEIKNYKLFEANSSAINYDPAEKNLWED